MSDSELKARRTKANAFADDLLATIKKRIEVNGCIDDLDQSIIYEELGDRIRQLESQAAERWEEQDADILDDDTHPALTVAERNGVRTFVRGMLR